MNLGQSMGGIRTRSDFANLLLALSVFSLAKVQSSAVVIQIRNVELRVRHS